MMYVFVKSCLMTKICIAHLYFLFVISNYQCDFKQINRFSYALKINISKLHELKVYLHLFHEEIKIKFYLLQL